MKQLIVVVVVAAAIAGGFYFFTAQKKARTLNDARKSEQSGDLQQALALYGAAAVASIPTLKIPQINHSKYLAPDLLKKDIATYFAWISTPTPKMAPDISIALNGINRCEAQNRSDNFLADTVIRPLTAEQFADEWNKTFFAPNVKIDPSHAALAAGNYIRKFSLLIIKSGQGYTYNLCLINPATNRATSSVLLPENSVRMYVVPGPYLLLCRSSVTFSSGQVWFSHVTPIRITIPQEPSLVTTQMRTSVPRKAK
jgi:hypothetical protein